MHQQREHSLAVWHHHAPSRAALRMGLADATAVSGQNDLSLGLLKDLCEVRGKHAQHREANYAQKGPQGALHKGLGGKAHHRPQGSEATEGVLLLQAVPGEALSGGRNLPANTTDFGVSGATTDVAIDSGSQRCALPACARRAACPTKFCAQ